VRQGTDETSRGIEQINQGTLDLSDVNEKNAYFVDEISQETQRLTEKAEQLHNIAGVFILDDKKNSKIDSKTEHYHFSDSKDRRESKTIATPLQQDLLSKAPAEDVMDDFLDKEFEKGFEEF